MTAFLSSLAIHLQGLHGLDPERTFVTGFSNGAEMCFQLACRESETFTAFAPIIGMMLDTLFTNCNPAVVRPILSMNGTADNVTLYNGDMNNSGGWGAYRPIPEMMEFWANLMETPNVTRTFLPDSVPSDGSTVRLDIYTSTEHSRSLWYYLVLGGGHDWPGQWGTWTSMRPLKSGTSSSPSIRSTIARMTRSSSSRDSAVAVSPTPMATLTAPRTAMTVVRKIRSRPTPASADAAHPTLIPMVTARRTARMYPTERI